MNPEHLAKVQEVTAQYHDLVENIILNPNHTDLVATQFDRLISSALNAFAYDVDSVTMEEADSIIRRITTRTDFIQELAQEGLTPFSCPITVEELTQVTPGMIPLMLGKACVSNNFHRIPAVLAKSPSWQKFVQLYACKLPSV